MRFKLFVLGFLVLMMFLPSWAHPQSLDETGKTYTIPEDFQGKRLEGYLTLPPKEGTVPSEDKKDQSVPFKEIEWIKFDKLRYGIPGAEKILGEEYYSVKLQNSQEIFTLKDRYTLSIKTEVGITTREIDPDVFKKSSKKESSSPAGSRNDSFFRDASVILSLEFKF